MKNKIERINSKIKLIRVINEVIGSVGLIKGNSDIVECVGVSNKFNAPNKSRKQYNVFVIQQGHVNNCNLTVDCVKTKQSNVVSGDNGRVLLENDMLRKQVEEKNREIEYLKEQLEFFKDLVKGRIS